MVLKNVKSRDRDFKWDVKGHRLYFQRIDDTITGLCMWDAETRKTTLTDVPREWTRRDGDRAPMTTSETAVGFQDMRHKDSDENEWDHFIQRGDRMVCWHGHRLNILRLIPKREDTSTTTTKTAIATSSPPPSS